MVEEFRKSINSILYKRVTSPFWGALISSWIVWNWEVFYITFFEASTEELKFGKIEYIKSYLAQNNFQIYWGPIISVIFILLIIPFISNGSYWISLQFNQWKVNQKIKIENKSILSKEKSIQLMSEIQNIEIKFGSLVDEKNELIKSLENDLKIIKEEKSNLKKENTNQKKLINENKNKNNFNPPFEGKWIYKTDNNEEKTFVVENNNILRFISGYEFLMYCVKRSESDSFRILMYPTQQNAENFKIKYIEIQRVGEGNEFNGNEAEVSVKDKNVKGNFRKLTISKS